MSWANSYILSLKEGKTITFRPKGNSMSGKIESGDLVTVQPIKLEEIKIGDIVLCKVKGKQYLHLVKAISNNSCLIGNNKGKVNGWTKQIYGKVIKVES